MMSILRRTHGTGLPLEEDAVQRTPREANQEADSLANGDTSLFDPAPDCVVDPARRQQWILPEPLKMRRQVEDG